MWMKVDQGGARILRWKKKNMLKLVCSGYTRVAGWAVFVANVHFFKVTFF